LVVSCIEQQEEQRVFVLLLLDDAAPFLREDVHKMSFLAMSGTE
jgi:hypothetical protein